MSDPTDVPNVPAAVVREQAHLRLPSRPDWIEPAVEYLKQQALLCGACQEKRAGKLMIALHEAVCNAVVHGNLEVSSELKEQDDDAFAQALAARAADPAYAGRTVDIFFDYDGQRCQWAITDEGPGFDVDAILRRFASDELELLLSSGRGILMMRNLMDDVAFEAGGRRVVLTLRKASGQEKRQQDRFSFSSPMRVAPVAADGSVDWDTAYRAVAQDLSRDGINFLQSHLAVSDRVMIAVEVDGAPVYLPAEVKHWRALGGDVVEIGCRFQSRPSCPPPGAADPVGEAIDSLLERVRGRQAQQHERREHPRVDFSEKIEVQTGPESAPAVGYTRDLSRSGIAFIIQGMLPGEIVLVFPPKGSEPALRVRAEIVRNSRVHDDFYDVGARFVELVDPS